MNTVRTLFCRYMYSSDQDTRIRMKTEEGEEGRPKSTHELSFYLLFYVCIYVYMYACILCLYIPAYEDEYVVIIKQSWLQENCKEQEGERPTS